MGKISADHDSRARVGHTSDLGPPTRAQVNVRARELAVLAGRLPPYVTQADYQQAKRELTGETDLDRQNAMLDAFPASVAAGPDEFRPTIGDSTVGWVTPHSPPPRFRAS